MSDLVKNMNANAGAPDSWCVLPWSHVSIKGNGTYRVCCHSATSVSRGTLRDTNGEALHIRSAEWEDAINNPVMKTVRKEMLEGKWPEPCLRCEREFKTGLSSRNIFERSSLAAIVEAEQYPNYQKTAALTQPDGSISRTDFPVSYLDIRFGNLCNLKCIMCSPTDSSQWYDDYSAVWGHTSFTDSGKKIKLVMNAKGKLQPEENVFDWSDDPTLWTQIERHILQFRRLHIVGGEPLLIDAHYEFLQKCVDQELASELVIEYNSNITNIPTRAWNIWKNFKQIVIGASVDGTGEVNDLIRFPSKWHTIESNLKKLDTAPGNFVIHITASISLLNAWNLPEFLCHVMESNYERVGQWESIPLISPHPVHRPAFLNLKILPEEAKVALAAFYAEWKTKILARDWEAEIGPSKRSTWESKKAQVVSVLDSYITLMHKVDYTETELDKYRGEFIMYMDKLDSLRGTDWATVCPELYKYTNTWRKT